MGAHAAKRAAPSCVVQWTTIYCFPSNILRLCRTCGVRYYVYNKVPRLMKFMSPERFRVVRTKVGLSLDALARVLRIGDKASVHRWEKGQRTISGPVSILMELLEAGELPSRYLDRRGDQDPDHSNAGS